MVEKAKVEEKNRQTIKKKKPLNLVGFFTILVEGIVDAEERRKKREGKTKIVEDEFGIWVVIFAINKG